MANLVPDIKLKKIINEYFSRPINTQITKSDLENINGYIYTDDSSIGNYISSLEGLQYAKNMKELLIENNLLIDISIISELDKLNTLFLNNNYIKKIPDLSKMTNLNSLLLSCNNIQDVTTIVTSKSLRVIKLNENRICDLSPLSSMEKHCEISAKDQEILIYDVADLSGYYILDISFLKDIHGKVPAKILPSNLGVYDEKNKKIIWEVSLVALKNPSFTFSTGDGSFSGEVIIDIIDFDQDIFIEDDILQNEIQNILDLKYDIITKRDMLKLRVLDLTNKDIKSLSGLEYAKNLYTLIIDETYITDLQYIPYSVTNFSANNLKNSLLISDERLKSLINIYLNKSNTSIITLDDMNELSILDEFNSNIKSLDGIQYANNLRILSLVRNKVSDISNLYNLSKLIYLDLSENNIYDLSSLSSIYKNITYIHANKQAIHLERTLPSNNILQLSLSFLKDINGKIINNINPSHNGKYMDDTNSIIWCFDYIPTNISFNFYGIDNIFSGTVYIYLIK